MSTLFIDSQYQALLKLHQLDNFNALWDAKIDWFEEPNERRGGWSGVGQLRLKTNDGEEIVLFVKKQQNHGRHTLKHPIQGEPTFRREFDNLQFLDKHQFKAPHVVYYGEDNAPNEQRAMLVTLALTQYQAFDEWVKSGYIQQIDSEKTDFLQTLARNIRRFHALGMVHRALYPKHIFINITQPSQIAVIDLEKARLTKMGWYRTYFDLAALFRHATWWNKEDQLIFFKAYCVKLQLNRCEQWLFRRILKRAAR